MRIAAMPSTGSSWCPVREVEKSCGDRDDDPEHEAPASCVLPRLGLCVAEQGRVVPAARELTRWHLGRPTDAATCGASARVDRAANTRRGEKSDRRDRARPLLSIYPRMVERLWARRRPYRSSCPRRPENRPALVPSGREPTPDRLWSARAIRGQIVGRYLPPGSRQRARSGSTTAI